MLKLSISASILNAISTSILTISHNAKLTEDTNPKLKAVIQEEAQRMANILDISVDEYLKNKEEKQVSKLTTLLKHYNLSTIPLINNKIITTNKTNDTLEISINDEYIIDCIELATKASVRMLKPLADLYVIAFDNEKDSKAVEAKWRSKQETVTSKLIDSSEVPTDILTKKDTIVESTLEKVLEVAGSKKINDWELIPKHTISETIMNTDGETFTKVNYLTAISKEGVKLNITTVKVKACIKLTNINVDIADDLGLPISLINAIRIYYNVTSLVI